MMGEENKQEVKEMNFFQKMLASIKDFDKYPLLASKHFTKTVSYLIILIILITMFCGVFFSINIYQKIGQAVSYIDKELPNMIYENENLIVQNNNEPIKIKIEDEMIQEVIIDSKEGLTQEQIEDYKKELKQNNTSILLLKDKMYFKLPSNNQLIEYMYKDFFEIYGIERLEKNDIVNYFSGNNKIMIAIAIWLTYCIYTFMINFIMALMYAIVIGFAGYVTAMVLRLRLRFTAMIKMAIHALTLPSLLLALYIAVNNLTGFTISYFDVMYITVAYIYVVAALFIIKSDVVKKQQELALIIEEQARVAAEKKAEKEEQEKERLEREEKERRKKRDKEKEEKQKDENNPSKPQADNV